MRLSEQAVREIVAHATEQVVAHVGLWVARDGGNLPEAEASRIEKLLALDFDRAVRYLELEVPDV